MHVGLFFGSFNPVHKGHEAIATYMLQFFDEVWLIVSPQNPFKVNHKLAPVELRLQWAKTVFEKNSRIKVSDVEAQLPIPSYTSQTLSHLQTKYPDHKFSIIMGADNLPKFYKWKNYKNIIHNHKLCIYNRTAKTNYILVHPNIIYTNAPLIDLSATSIRDGIASGANIENLIDDLIVARVQNYYNGITP